MLFECTCIILLDMSLDCLSLIYGIGGLWMIFHFWIVRVDHASLLTLFLCFRYLISFLLFLYASVWDDTIGFGELMYECLPKHSRMSSPNPIAILNGTFAL